MSSFRTVPQIFLDQTHIGGFDDLVLSFRRSAGETREAGTETKGAVRRSTHLFGNKRSAKPK